MMSLRATATLGAARRAATSRGFAFAATSRLGLKESSSQTDVDLDKHKQDSLAKQKKGSGHWKSELASDSEEALKADRNESGDPKTLQERTKGAAEEKHKAGTSSHDGH
jgi:hypothetical protein